MARYIDLEMTVDASRTRELLGWQPRPRLHILRHLMNAVRNLERGMLVSYCRHLAARRFQQGFEAREVTLTWGCDEAQQVFEHLAVRCRNSHLRPDCRERDEAAARRAALVSADRDGSTP